MVKGTWNVGVALSACEKASVLLSCAFGIFSFWCFEMYSVVLLKPNPTIVTTILNAVYTFVCTFILLILFAQHAHFTLYLVFGIIISYFFLTIWRISLYNYHKNRSHRQKMLMVEKLKDDNSRVRRMKYACMSRFDAWYEQVNVESKESVQEFIDKFFPIFDVICLMDTVPFDIRNMFMEAGIRMNKDFYVVPMMYEMNLSKVKLAYLDDVMVFHLSPTQMTPFNMFLKRLTDIVCSSIGLIVAAVPMCIIALLIKLTSPGPVFYKQLRLTKDKKEFYIYNLRWVKLRCMAHKEIGYFDDLICATWPNETVKVVSDMSFS